MNDHFDRAPGAGRTRGPSMDPGLAVNAKDAEAKTAVFNPREPLRQPRTIHPFPESSINSAAGLPSGDHQPLGSPLQSVSASHASMDSVVRTSTLSASAPEFVPFGMSSYEEPAYYDDSESYYSESSLADTVTDFLDHLSSSPGSFDFDVENITGMLNCWVTTEELLKELVELIFTQSTAIPNFAYTGARLCNYLSHHLTLSPQSGNFRRLLLQRCQLEYEQRNVAVRGNPEVQKKFHSFVLFLGELYLNLEIKSGKAPPNRAEILLLALKDLLESLLSHPVDANLICAVKLLKLTGSILDDAWKASGRPHMDELVQRIETILLDATCSRDVRQMLLKLVELRSSDWGRVCSAAATSNATPDNDPNYFMNEPTFYTEDGTPFTAADPEYAEKYQELLEKQDYFHEVDGENGNEEYDFEDEMDPEIEEAYENFCLESEKKRQQ
ncbi:PREDICTED: polyadenylate-binding protein-interacting protein 1 [Cyprinodon variegatus]|uniref:Polyadenylate-binding protein-interacting protein 1 n=1 Tax=Cyprinodon variegatus TaxID=28743 RepID=A0A3Q2DDG4_CYPVA|nr:PREDICTED: polyadenylate-binding protein-interacting protein 1 [Cyprinodon variegatus]